MDILALSASMHREELIICKRVPRSGRNPAKVDEAVLDAFNTPRGYWDA